MVATRGDINRWNADAFFQPFREKVRTMLREKPAIFIGISGQDFNLQAECATATAGGVAYPLNPPRIVFTVERIDPPQRAILEGFYGDRYSANVTAVNEIAALPLYGKPLLGALFVQLLIEKLVCLLIWVTNNFPQMSYVH